MIDPKDLDALEAAAVGVLGVACVAIEPGYTPPIGPTATQGALLDKAQFILRLVRAHREAQQPEPRPLDVWRESERLRARVAELESWLRYALNEWAPGGSDKAEKARRSLDGNAR